MLGALDALSFPHGLTLCLCLWVLRSQPVKEDWTSMGATAWAPLGALLFHGYRCFLSTQVLLQPS